MISADFPYEKKRAEVLGRHMAYVDEPDGGSGRSIVFLHGNPTSSYLWRNVMPHLDGRGRLIAPDLIGMGDSAKLDDSGPSTYRFVEHRRYLDALLDELDPGDDVVLVIHDWGSALGFDWANRHRDRVRGICYMEAIVSPVSWAQWPDDARKIFELMRSDAGDELVLEKNIFVDRILPGSILRTLSDEEMAAYRQPFRQVGEPRRPTLTWPREIPFRGEGPQDVHDIVEDYGRWLEKDGTLPKLFINAEPGSILVGEQREFCRSWPNQQEITVPGSHFIQEDSPDEIGEAVARFVDGLDRS
ncbi:MAG: haloalkane dehalogenase [Salinisphaeraceae bacterium]|nr:haloalkane dehalogenase [Salinisphaeraceae bacterium]